MSSWRIPFAGQEGGRVDEDVAGARRRRLLTIAFGVMVAVYVALVYVLPQGYPLEVIQGLLYVTLPIGAATACLVALWRSPRAYAPYWVLLAYALLLMAIGDTHLTWVQVVPPPGVTLGPALGDLVMLAGYAPLLMFVVLLIRSRLGLSSRVVKARFIIDALMAITMSVFAVMATLLVVWATVHKVSVSGVWYIHWTQGLIASAVGNSFGFYALLDVAVLVGISVAIASTTRGRRRSWAMQTSLAMAMMAVADIAAVLVSVSGSEPAGLTGALLDISWMTSYFIFAHAAGRFIAGDHAIESEPGEPLELERRPRWFEMLPMAAAVVFVPAFMALAHYRTSDDFTYWIVADMATWLGCLVVARIAVTTVTNRQLMSQSITDSLTGLYNHRFFYDRLEVELGRARRTGESVSVAVIDLDDFRLVNDSLGHLSGDVRLREISRAIARGARSSDTPCRIGGDEFALIMPATNALDAFSVSLRITASIAEIDDGDHVRTTASAGIATFPKDASDKVALVRAADKALYWAKDHGRDQTRIYDPEIGTAEGPRDRIRRLEEESLLRTVRTLAAAVDARDAYTHSHSHNVASFALALARGLGLDEDHARRIEMAALLHDVGKIGVRDSILGKQGELDRFEYEMVREHPVLGEKILRSTAAQDILPWVLHHHERWDGAGYPEGLVGEAIPFEARIIALCDAYDAMRSDRPYRDGISEAGALTEISAKAGEQFDPKMVRVFIELVRNGGVTSPLEHRTETP